MGKYVEKKKKSELCKYLANNENDIRVMQVENWLLLSLLMT